MNKASCYHCRTEWEFESPMGRREICPKCGRDAKVCLNCQFYDAGSYRECREPQASWVKEKDRGNFCGYFTARAHAGDARGDEGRQKLDALFGGHSPMPDTAKSQGLRDELADFLNRKK